MGIQFSWFKTYTIETQEKSSGWSPQPDEYRICFGDEGGSVSLGYSSTSDIQDRLVDVTGNLIPHISEFRDFDKQEEIDDILMKPDDMSKLLEIAINHKDIPEDMKDRLAWFKKLSDDGFYIVYE